MEKKMEKEIDSNRKGEKTKLERDGREDSRIKR